MLRNAYMEVPLQEQPAAHRKYYGQFVDEWLKTQVANNFGVERLKRAYREDVNFNSIPLCEWNSWYSIISQFTNYKSQLKARGDFITYSNVVCLLKEVALQVVLEALAVKYYVTT